MTAIRSGDEAHCGWCGFEGHVYGAPYAGGVQPDGVQAGVSAPWCPRCDMNDWLMPLSRLRKPAPMFSFLDGIPIYLCVLRYSRGRSSDTLDHPMI